MKARKTAVILSLAATLLTPAVVLAAHDLPSEGPKTRAQVLHELDEARKDGSLPYLQRSQPVPSKAFGPAKTRAQVEQELEQARKDGTLDLIRRNQTIPAKASGPGKTREEVQREVLNMSVSERYRLNRPNM